jgi:hypothetical protein
MLNNVIRTDESNSSRYLMYGVGIIAAIELAPVAQKVAEAVISVALGTSYTLSDMAGDLMKISFTGEALGKAVAATANLGVKAVTNLSSKALEILPGYGNFFVRSFGTLYMTYAYTRTFGSVVAWPFKQLEKNKHIDTKNWSEKFAHHKAELKEACKKYLGYRNFMLAAAVTYYAIDRLGLNISLVTPFGLDASAYSLFLLSSALGAASWGITAWATKAYQATRVVPSTSLISKLTPNWLHDSTPKLVKDVVNCAIANGSISQDNVNRYTIEARPALPSMVAELRHQVNNQEAVVGTLTQHAEAARLAHALIAGEIALLPAGVAPTAEQDADRTAKAQALQNAINARDEANTRLGELRTALTAAEAASGDVDHATYKGLVEVWITRLAAMQVAEISDNPAKYLNVKFDANIYSTLTSDQLKVVHGILTSCSSATKRSIEDGLLAFDPANPPMDMSIVSQCVRTLGQISQVIGGNDVLMGQIKEALATSLKKPKTSPFARLTSWLPV